MFLYGKGATEGNLDMAIDSQGQYMLEQIPENSILAIIGISSGSEDLSKYITEGLTSYIMNNNMKNVKIVERAAMSILQKEISFQYSGAVDDDFMISLGKMVGSNIVIAGTIYSINNDLRFNVRAIEIETGYVIAANGIDFTADKKVKILLNGESIEKTLNRDNIPIRHNDGSISKANQELREKEKKFIKNTVNFWTTVLPDRVFRGIIGYNYSPKAPIGAEIGILRNGIGFYTVFNGGESKTPEYSTLEMGAGLSYPLYFSWLWVNAGIGFGELWDWEYYNFDTSWSTSQYFEWRQNRVDHAGSYVFFQLGITINYGRIYSSIKYHYRPDAHYYLICLSY
jgi:TolB-like protein